MIKRLLIYLPYIVLISVGLFFIITTVPAVRYWVDDFCSATFLRNNGFFGAQIGWWRSWTGRYSYIAILDLFELIGPWVVRVLPILLFAGLVITAIQLFFSNVIFALLFVVLALINAPNIIQSFYWQTGSLNYTIPFIFLNIFLAPIVSNNGKRNLIISFLLMFIAGGFSESFAVAAVVFIIFVLGMVLVINPKDKSEKIKIAVAGIVGLVVSLIVMSLAPGNVARGLTVTKPESLIFVIKSTILTTKWYLLRFLSIKTFLSSLGILTAAVFFFFKNHALETKKAVIVMTGSILAVILLTAAVIGSGFYSMSIIPPERTLFIVTTMVLMCFLVFVYCLRAVIEKYLSVKVKNIVLWVAIIVNIVFSMLVTASMVKHWTSIKSEIVTYAKTWDTEVKNLPNIKNIKAVGGLDSFTDNKGWVAGCVAEYYKTDRIEITE